MLREEVKPYSICRLPCYVQTVAPFKDSSALVPKALYEHEAWTVIELTAVKSRLGCVTVLSPRRVYVLVRRFSWM